MQFLRCHCEEGKSEAARRGNLRAVGSISHFPEIATGFALAMTVEVRQTEATIQRCHCEEAQRADAAISGKYVIVQIFPTRVHAIDQLIFSFPVPTFDLLFPFDRCCDIRCRFIIYQLMDVVSCCKAVGVQRVFMFIDTLYQVICHTGVYGGIGCIRENIHIICHISVLLLP